jgi:hypothetical protein
MKSCPICKERISITSSLCKDCKKIKSFIALNSKEILLNMIMTYSPVIPRRINHPPSAPYDYKNLSLYPSSSNT